MFFPQFALVFSSYRRVAGLILGPTGCAIIPKETLKFSYHSFFFVARASFVRRLHIAAPRIFDSVICDLA